MMQELKEELVALDLKHLIGTIINVDRHRSKMGTDRDIIVIAIKINDRNATEDLENFIERGYPGVLDADSSVSDEDNEYTCFIEVRRDKTFIKTFNEMLVGISLLTGIDDFIFKYHKSNISLSKDEFLQKVPITPEKYDAFLINEKNVSVEIDNMRTVANLSIPKQTNSINTNRRD